MSILTSWNNPANTRLGRASRARTVLLVATLSVFIGACGASDNPVEPEAAVAAEPAAELDPTPAQEERPGMQEATDGSVTFRVWEPSCDPLASEEDGTPIEGMGRYCIIEAEVTNDGTDPVTLSVSRFIAIDANGAEYTANNETRLVWAPVEPGQTIEGTIGWTPVPFDVEIVTLQLTATEDSAGVEFDFVDPMFSS